MVASEHSGAPKTARNQLAVSGGRGLQMTNYEDFWRFAGAVVKSRMAPRSLDTQEKVFIALQMGAELGLSPMQSIKNIAVVNNSPSVWGDALIALVRRSPVCKSIGEPVYTGSGETRMCSITAERTNGDKQTSTFGYADAKRAGLLSKDTYKSYPDRMYKHRAFGVIADDLFADVLCGIDTVEEMQDLAYSQQQPKIASGDDAPLDSLDDAANLIDADVTHTSEPAPEDWPPNGPTPEELADPEYVAAMKGGNLFNDSPQYQ
jgi:hypothetical protein